MSIPRTLFPRSTARNRLRRQILEVIRIFKKDNGLYKKPSGFERQRTVIRVHKKKEKLSFGAIRKEIMTHLEKCGVSR